MRKTVVLVLGIGVAAFALSGCAAAAGSGLTGASGGSSTASGGSSSGSGGSGGSSASGPIGKIDVCSVMPAAKASSLTGKTFTSATSSVLATGVYSCSYAPDDGGYNWSIAVYEPNASQGFDDLVNDLGGQSDVKSVSGIGDKADTDPVGVVAMFGKDLIEVAAPEVPDGPTTNEAGYAALAKGTIAALG
jgi:hypothetical protein